MSAATNVQPHLSTWSEYIVFCGALMLFGPICFYVFVSCLIKFGQVIHFIVSEMKGPMRLFVLLAIIGLIMVFVGGVASAFGF